MTNQVSYALDGLTTAPTGDRSILYLSGAPRLSTRPTTESLGPRSHMLGVIRAFGQLGWNVSTFIVGDSTPESISGEGSEARMSSSRVKILGADVLRLGYRLSSRVRLRKKLAAGVEPAIAYERYALFQELGSVAKSGGAYWILEVNALLAVEATSERRATSNRFLAAAFERRTLSRADLIVAVTDTLAETIASAYAIPRERIVTVENGVDSSVHQPADGKTAATPTIGFLGSLYEWQRVGDLLEVMATPAGEPWRLRVAGTGPELASLKEEARSLGIDQRVEFLGRIHPDEVPSFLTTVDVCYAGHASSNGVYFSPLKLWEYLAAGKPVVASSHETTDRLAEQGFAVLTFADREKLDGVLADALRERAVLAERAAAKQPSVWMEHSWRTRVSQLLDTIASRNHVHG